MSAHLLVRKSGVLAQLWLGLFFSGCDAYQHCFFWGAGSFLMFQVNGKEN